MRGANVKADSKAWEQKPPTSSWHIDNLIPKLFPVEARSRCIFQTAIDGHTNVMRPILFSAIMLMCHSGVECQRSIWDIILGITPRDLKHEAIQRNTVDTNAPAGRIKSSVKGVIFLIS